MLSFKPHIPKEVSNTILLLCGESSFTKGFGTEDQATTPPRRARTTAHTHKHRSHIETGTCTLGNLSWTVHPTLYITPHQTELHNAAVRRKKRRGLQFIVNLSSPYNLRKSPLSEQWWHDSCSPAVTRTTAQWGL